MAGLGDIHKKIKTAPPATDGPTFDPFSGYGNDVVERANGLIPLGKYSDGNVRPAWPSWISEPASAAWNAWDNASYAGGHNDPETTAAMARGSFDAASLAPIGGALTGAVPEGAVAANGIVYRGGPISSKYRAVLSSDPANAAAYGEVTPATTHFRNPMEVDAGGRHWQDIPFEDGSTNIESLANRATERGHDGLTVRNVLDSPVGTKNPVPQDTTFALRRGTVRNADTGALLYANNKNAAAVPLLTQSGDRGAANGIGARIKGLFGKHDAPQEPHKIDYPKYGTDGPLKLWHVSPNSFDKFDPEMSGSVHGNSGYPKSLFFAGEGISGPNGGLTTALDKNGKPWSDSNYSYQVEINRDGAKTLDWNAPFEAQTPETQAILSDNKDDLIRWGWPQNDQVPMAATDFPSGVPLREHFNFGIDYPPSLDKMGFDIVHNLDETMVRDASRLKIISRNGEKIGANSPTGASVPLAMQAMEKRGLPDGYSLVRRPVEGGNPEYTVTSKDGHEVGAFSSIINSGSDAASVYSAYVHPDHRGKFTAEAYQGIGDDLGKAIVPSTTLLEPGYAFWNKHRPEALKNYPTYDSYREGYLRRPKSGERGVTAFSNSPTGASVPLAMQAMEKQGAGLAMDEASRMARAREMGFDTDTAWYHGSPNGPFDEFDPTKTGSRFGYDTKGHFLTSDPIDARYYSFPPDADRGLRLSAAGKAEADARTMKLYARMEKPLTLDELSKHPDFKKAPYNDPIDIYDNNRALIEGLEGYDGVDLNFRGQRLANVFDPKNLRRADAAFDPAQSDSANLLAANHPMASASSLAFSEDPQAEGYASGGGVPTLDDFMRRHEGFSPRASWDYHQNSNGYGTKARYPGEEISREEAELRFQAEKAQARAIVEQFAPQLDEGSKAALTDLTYNAGDKWTRSGLGEAVQSGDLNRAKSLYLQYVKAGGQTLPGLVNRRQEAASMFGAQMPDGPTLAQSAPQSDFFADKPLTLAGNEMPSWGPPMALGGPDYTQNPEAVDSANPQGNLVSSPAPFNAQSYRVAPENQGRHADYMKEPSGADWVQGPLGLMPKYSDGSMPLQGFKDGGRVGGLGDLRVAKPTDAQKEAGNYKKAHVNVQGLDITIENTKGSERAGIDKGGKRWSVKLPDHYGYFKRTLGYDGDHVDCYVGPEPEAEKAYVIDQVDAETGKFDEHKVMLGYASESDAREAYTKAFTDGKAKDRLGHLTPMPVADLKDWLMNGDTKRPLGPQKFAYGGAVGYASGGPVSLQPGYSGPLHSEVHGRTDEIPLEVSSGSYIIPSDIVSALGQGNTLGGFKVLEQMFPQEAPTLQFSAGGRVPIIVAGGEHALSPEQVAKIGGGDLNAGHSALDSWVGAVRAHTIQTLQSLPPPAKE